jgi:YjjG family noncanonical pyrimidine nucleotidase
MERYHWVLLDADHTLFDFDKASEEALSEVLAPHGVNWRPGMYADYKKINMQCWAEHEQGLIDRDTLVYQRFSRYFDLMQLELDPVSTQQQYLEALGSKPYRLPWADDLLGWCRGKVKLGYITNGMSAVQRPRLEMIGWHIVFDVIIIAGEIGHSKPHHGYFDYVHQQMGQPEKSKVLVVGDSLTADIAGGVQFGYHTCWYNPEGEQCHGEPKPHFTISHLQELPEILNS